MTTTIDPLETWLRIAAEAPGALSEPLGEWLSAHIIAWLSGKTKSLGHGTGVIRRGGIGNLAKRTIKKAQHQIIRDLVHNHYQDVPPDKRPYALSDDLRKYRRLLDQLKKSGRRPDFESDVKNENFYTLFVLGIPPTSPKQIKRIVGHAIEDWAPDFSHHIIEGENADQNDIA